MKKIPRVGQRVVVDRQDDEYLGRDGVVVQKFVGYGIRYERRADVIVQLPDGTCRGYHRAELRRL